MKKQMDFLSANWLKLGERENVTKILHLHYGYVKCIDFFSIKYKI